jgi:hypothetical protein
MNLEYFVISKRSISFLISFVLLLGVSYSQQAYNKPFCVVYCPGDTSYYIANTGENNILRRDAGAALSVFASSASALDLVKGMCIWESNDLSDRYLYVSNAEKIHVFNLNTGEQDSSITVNGAITLAGLAIDNSGTFLYAADYTTNKVYRVNRLSGEDTILINSGLFMPYAIYLDASVNRLLIASSDPLNATIKTFFINTGNLIVSVPNPPKQLTGITRDGEGYWYVSSWITYKVYRYHPSLIPAPTEVIVPGETISGPTGIYCNTFGNPDVLVIPSTFNDEVYFLPIVTVGVPGSSDSEDPVIIHPNPGTRFSELTLTITRSSRVRVRLCDIRGAHLTALFEGRLEKGTASFRLPAEELPSGTYLLEVSIGGDFYRKKWVLLP